MLCQLVLLEWGWTLATKRQPLVLSSTNNVLGSPLRTLKYERYKCNRVMYVYTHTHACTHIRIHTYVHTHTSTGRVTWDTKGRINTKIQQTVPEIAAYCDCLYRARKWPITGKEQKCVIFLTSFLRLVGKRLQEVACSSFVEQPKNCYKLVMNNWSIW